MTACKKKIYRVHREISRMNNYFVYILTNINKTVLYIGVTNSLKRRLYEHKEQIKLPLTFTQKYKVFYLIYFERFQDINQAIDRETVLKKWSRKKKEALINEFNPEWRFLNDEVD